MSVSSDSYDAIVVGGGPAGTSAAIHLAMRGARVMLAEQKKFPRAKLCGEFISPECLDHFARLGVAQSMTRAGGAEVSETLFYSRGGASVSVPSKWFGAGRAVALGLSRAEMDEHLMSRARDVGVDVLEEARAMGLLMEDGRVVGVRLKVCGREREYRSRVTLDATGRARALARHIESSDRNRRERKRAPLVAFKAHLEGAQGNPEHCEIYFYRGGYGGLSGVEGGLSNLCFIVSARDARDRNGAAARVLRAGVSPNPPAARTLSHARPCSEWLGVALESFGRHEPAPAEGLLAVGDAASFIDPFTGSGMLMALESGAIAAHSVARWLDSAAASPSYGGLASEYRRRYAERFNTRLRVCSVLRRAAFVPRLAEVMMLALGASAGARRRLARATRRSSIGLPGEGRA
jgi:flavin-dependent dehydrogenase